VSNVKLFKFRAHQIAQAVSVLNTTGNNVYSYPLQEDRVAVFLLDQEQLALLNSGEFKLRNLGRYVVLRPTSTAGCDPETHPIEVEYTEGPTEVGAPMIVGTYSEEATLSVVVGYIVNYMLHGQLPPLPKGMVN